MDKDYLFLNEKHRISNTTIVSNMRAGPQFTTSQHIYNCKLSMKYTIPGVIKILNSILENHTKNINTNECFKGGLQKRV